MKPEPSSPRADAQERGRRLRDLCDALGTLASPEQRRRFLEDLCTPDELESMSDRWHVARLLHRGLPYRAIYARTGVSTATVTRVGRALKTGAGGYEAALGRAREPGRRKATP
jgi:TrpR-related protein YerC/YecD